jgi:hypothetical protein
MRRAAIVIRVEALKRVYEPGDQVQGDYVLDGVTPEQVRAVELSVLWHTEGKGDEDLAVHHFDRASRETDPEWDPRQPRRFSTTMPNSPLSYDGVIVKIHWRIRVRAFLAGGREVVEEQRLQLGHVPMATPVTAQT